MEIVRCVIDAWNRRDIDELLAHIDPGIEYVNPRRQSSRVRGGVSRKSALSGGRSGTIWTAASRSTGALTVATRSSSWVVARLGSAKRCSD